MVSEANEPGSESGKRSDGRRRRVPLACALPHYGKGTSVSENLATLVDPAVAT